MEVWGKWGSKHDSKVLMLIQIELLKITTTDCDWKVLVFGRLTRT